MKNSVSLHFKIKAIIELSVAKYQFFYKSCLYHIKEKLMNQKCNIGKYHTLKIHILY